MTEKRFNVFDIDGTIFLEDHKKGSYHIGEIGNVDVNCLNDIADRLNELNDEKTELKKENEQLKQDIGELQNDKLLTGLQMKCDKKQEHIVLLENKIHRMREQIKKLEGLYHYRGYIGSGDVKKECYKTEKLYAQLKKENTNLKHEVNYLQDRLDDYVLVENENNELKKIILFANDLITPGSITQHDYWKFRTLCKDNGVDLG